jgi:hypothetical protein
VTEFALIFSCVTNKLLANISFPVLNPDFPIKLLLPLQRRWKVGKERLLSVETDRFGVAEAVAVLEAVAVGVGVAVGCQTLLVSFRTTMQRNQPLHG